LVAPVAPKYPPEARSQEIEADVVLGIVVGTSGQVADARVLQPAGYGFDREALSAIRNARFRPAELDGQPVAVRMRWSVSFRLH
jgi:protein TonB